jgi:hypothetical protein
LNSPTGVSSLHLAGALRSAPRLAPFLPVIPTTLMGGLSADALPVPRYDCSKAQRELGLSFIPPERSMVDMAEALVDLGVVGPPPAAKL